MIKYLIFLIFCFFALSAKANVKAINIVTYGNNPVKEQYIETLKLASLYKFNEIDLTKHKIEGSQGVYIAIGAKALNHLIELELKAPILTVFVKRNSFYHTIQSAEHKSLANGKLADLNNIGAIYSDPSIEQQLDLIKGIFGVSASIGVITSQLSSFMKDELSLLVDNQNLSIKFVNYDPNDNINKTINSIKEQSVLLALPDSLVWNSTTLKNIVLSTYRNEQPIVGFSRSLVKAGSIATYYSDLDHIVLETVNRLKLMNEEQPINIRASSKYNFLVTNDNVLRSFNLKKPINDNKYKPVRLSKPENLK